MTKTVKVYSSDSSNPLTQLVITAFGEEPQMKFGRTPEIADFGEVLVDHKSKMKLELNNTDSSNVELEVVAKPLPEYVKKYKINSESLKPGQMVNIEVELQKDIALGAFKTALTMQAKGNPASRFTIPITGTIVGKLTPKEEIEKKAEAAKQAAQLKTPPNKSDNPPGSTVKPDTTKVVKSGGSGDK